MTTLENRVWLSPLVRGMRSQLYRDFRLLVEDAGTAVLLEEAKIGVTLSYGALTADERGELENLIADKLALLKRAGKLTPDGELTQRLKDAKKL